MTAKRYFVTCEVGDCICELISRKLSDDEFEHLTYQDITDRLNELADENEQLKKSIECQNEMIKEQCMKIDWASECGVKWDKEFKEWSGVE